MRFAQILLAIASVAVVALPVMAADTAPEIKRDAIPAQPIGSLRSLKTIPEACARIQGQFTGDPAQPYKFAVVRTSAKCQPRARLVDATKIEHSAEKGWIFNDLIRVPSIACATQQAVVRVWRHPVEVAPPKLDKQGRSRIYLKESLQQARANKLPPIPVYAAAMSVEGAPCKGG
jgi:hypothetical protein